MTLHLVSKTQLSKSETEKGMIQEQTQKRHKTVFA